MALGLVGLGGLAFWVCNGQGMGGLKWLLLYHGVDILLLLIVRCIHWVGVVGYSGEGMDGWISSSSASSSLLVLVFC